MRLGHRNGKKNYNHFEPKYKNPLKMDDLFITTKDKKDSYSICGYFDNEDYISFKRVYIDPKLKAFLLKTIFLYELSPNDYYFDIGKRKFDNKLVLRLKYQKIIGSRALCFIDEESIKNYTEA